MTTITTNTYFNFDKAESVLFSWTHWDGTSGGILTHKPDGRQIYQMHWLKNGKMDERVEGETREAAIAFWNELSRITEEREAESRKASLERFLSEVDEINEHEELMRKMDDPNSDY